MLQVIRDLHCLQYVCDQISEVPYHGSGINPVLPFCTSEKNVSHEGARLLKIPDDTSGEQQPYRNTDTTMSLLGHQNKLTTSMGMTSSVECSPYKGALENYVCAQHPLFRRITRIYSHRRFCKTQ